MCFFGLDFFEFSGPLFAAMRRDYGGGMFFAMSVNICGTKYVHNKCILGFHLVVKRFSHREQIRFQKWQKIHSFVF